ncbi:Uncharacterised protein [Raoultella terrigena]|uniref:Uncharacterized protein n=1 Tax=Raoultella terrigena TaxID=577 RepID=A0A3P8KMN0_RAOTE|nr:Uncharacterised protein [Raoultella terrigena]
MERGDRDVQFGVIGVGEHQVFTLDAAGLEGSHSRIAADAVLKMHHRLADMQLRKVANQGIGVDGAP